MPDTDPWKDNMDCPKCGYHFHPMDLVCDRCGWVPEDVKELNKEKNED